MTPLELFVGRRCEIDAFQKLLLPDAASWAMLITGLSGSGKSLLIDHLRQEHCTGVPNARVQITPNTMPSDLLLVVAAELDAAFARTLEEAALSPRLAPLVEVVSPRQVVEARYASQISDATQTSNIAVHIDASAAEIEALERESRRLERFMGALAPLRSESWVLFIDEAEHLEHREIGHFLFGRLLPRLRARFPRMRLVIAGQSLPEEMALSQHEALDLFPTDRRATAAAIHIYALLDDEDQLRRLTVLVEEDWPAAVRIQALNAEGLVALRRHQGSAQALIAALEREPHRRDLVCASMLAASGLPFEEFVELSKKVIALAGSTLQEVTQLSLDGMFADPNQRVALEQMRRNPGLPLFQKLGLPMAMRAAGLISIEEARADLQKLKDSHPDQLEAVESTEIDLLLNAGLCDEAEALIGADRPFEELSEATVVHRIRLLKCRQDWPSAIALLERAAETYPNAARDLLEERVDLEIAHGEPTRALKVLERIEREAPLSLGLEMSRSHALSEIGRHDEAVSTLEVAIENAEEGAATLALAWRVLGSCRRAADRAEEAVAADRRAVEILPRNAAGHLGLSRSLEATGRIEEAYRALLDAIALDPSMMTREEARLRRLRREALEPAAPAAP